MHKNEALEVLLPLIRQLNTQIEILQKNDDNEITTKTAGALIRGIAKKLLEVGAQMKE